MRRWIAIAAAVLLMIGGVVVWRLGGGGNAAAPALPQPSAPASFAVGADETAAPMMAPAGRERPERSRQASRLARYDKDDDRQVSLEEYLANRRRSYDRLDVDGDGTLSFEEYTAKSAEKFAEADGDKSNALSPAEFAMTAPKRSQRRECPPAAQPEADPFPA